MWLEKPRKSWKHICWSKRSVRLFFVLFLIGILSTGCGGKAEEKDSYKAEETAGEENTWKLLSVSEEEKQQAETVVKQAAKAYHGIFPYQEAGKAISADDKQKVLKAMGSQGLSAIASESGAVMENGQALERFYEKTQDDKTGEASIVRVNPSGGFSAIFLKSEAGNLTGILATAVWESDGEISISELVKYKVKQLELTAEGKMICEFYLSDQDEMQNDGLMEFCLK